MLSDVINEILGYVNTSLAASHTLLWKVSKIFEFENNENEDENNGTERQHLIPKAPVVSLSSSSSDSEFDDILSSESSHTANAENAEESHHERRVTTLGALFHLLKANIWTGLLAMPKAMSHFGLLAGILGVLILGSIYIYCTHLLLDINRAIVKRVLLDRHIQKTAATIEVYKKISKKYARKNKKFMKNAKGCVNSVEKEYKILVNWRKKFSEDFEVGESSSKKEDSNKSRYKSKGKSSKYFELQESSSDEDISKTHCKWKKTFSEDFEVGESSTSKKSDSNKNSSNLKQKSGKHIRKEESIGDNSKKGNNVKEDKSKDSEVDESSPNKDSSEEKGNNVKEDKSKDSEVDESSPNKDSSEEKKISIEQANSKDSKVEESSSSKKNGSKKKLATWKKEDAKEILESSSEAHSNKSLTQTNEMYVIDIEEKESNENTSKNTQEQNDEQSTEVVFKFFEEDMMRTLDYPKLVELSFHYGMKKFKWLGKIVKKYVQLLIMMTHFGCCCVCFLFVAENLNEMATKAPFTHFNSFEMVGYAVPIMICLSFIPDRHELTGVTIVAVLLQLIGVFMMLYYFFDGEHEESRNWYIAPVETWYLYFGIIFYAFEGVGMTLHLESHMEKKKKLRGWGGILNKSMYFIIPLFALFGALGYWKIGNDIETSVTFNLPGGRFTDMIQIMTSMGILLTYPFHLSFILTPIKKTFIQDEFSETSKQVIDLVLRAAIVIFTFVISALTPYLELQLTVLGAATSCCLVLVIPPYMSLNSYFHLIDLNYSRCRVLFHCFIMLIGLAGTIIGSYTTFKNIHLYYPNATIFG